MNDIEVIEVKSETVTFKTNSGSITLAPGKKRPRVIVEIGYTTPIEYKKSIKKYYAIVRDYKGRHAGSIN